MDIMSIVFPVLTIGGMGVLFGLFLGFAGVKFKVEQDPKIPEVREALPGANCGGCGFAGCDALAEAIVTGKAEINACPVGGNAVAEKVGKIMGVEVKEGEKTVAFVKCSGDCQKASSKYEYKGIKDCSYENALAGGSKDCSYGCLGDGNCVKACQFGALSIVNGIAVVDEEKCVACGKCVSQCPKHIIELVPANNRVRVHCSSKDMPKDVKSKCTIGCMGCTLCKRNCPNDAVVIESFLAKVDYSKCTQCGACIEKCPTKAIRKEA
jgi:Na+-translocating ferredoxin:NAD+ oxidoreductase RNF subunit RnfB